MYISFTNSQYLIFLFGIPLLIFIHFYTLKNIKGNSLRFANFEAIAKVKGVDLYSKNILGLIFNIILFIIMVLALSSLTIHKEVNSSDFTFVILIDSSESMTAKDIQPDRFSTAKEEAINFIDSLPHESYVGIISFSGNSKIAQELTKNKQQLKDAIENLEISQVRGTDINEAVINAIGLLKNKENKAIILLSDGQINVGNLESTIQSANSNKVMIHTFGIGSKEGGETTYGISKLDEDALKSLSYNTEGKFFPIDNKEKMKESFSQIITVTRRISPIELNSYLIMLLIVLFIIKEFLTSTNKIGW